MGIRIALAVTNGLRGYLGPLALLQRNFAEHPDKIRQSIQCADDPNCQGIVEHLMMMDELYAQVHSSPMECHGRQVTAVT
jgi:hypothetical protein